MEFRILGPLEICSGSTVIGLAAAKERALLARLLVDANQVVSSDRLVDELWEGSPPETAMNSVRVLVSRLRKTLSEIDDAAVLVTRAPGYLVTVEPGGLDASRFEALAARGRAQASAGDAEGAARIFREALDLWRGPALADGGDIERIRMEATRLEESRLGVLEDRVEADLACGREAELVSELEALTATHRGRERLWSQRMLALYRTGRQAEALAVYGQLKTALDGELGIEPSAELVALETAIIRQDASLDRQGSSGQSEGVALPSGVVTFLLTDIEGSTPLWETKPAVMATALERHDELLRSVMASHDGTLLRTRGEGDATFSVFARATDAAEAALEAQSMIASEVWPGGIGLRVRMALMTGECVERDGDYNGTTVNRAARLRGIAEAGQILVSRSTADVIVDHLEGAELVELGEQSLRGLRRPERIYELRPARSGSPETAPASIEVPLPAPLRRATTRVFVGRDSELEELAALWAAVRPDEPELVLLAGEPGIGKSRLAAEFADRVQRSGATVVFGRCDEDAAEPYQPFAEGLRGLLTVHPTARASGGELDQIAPEAGAKRAPRTTPRLDDPTVERRALFDAFARTIARSSASAVLLVIDDVQWAERPTLQMLRHLLRSPMGAKVMILATYRDTDVSRSHPLVDTLTDLRRETRFTRVALSGINADDVAAYVEAASGRQLDAAERQLAELVHEQTEGNPLFVVEVVRHFLEAGAVYRVDDRWHIDLEKIDAIGLPEGLREVITQRIARLPDTARRTLRVAAHIGSEFALDVLERSSDATDGGDVVIDALELTIRVGLLSETGTGTYAFTHALIRRALLDDSLSTRRARIHRRIGEAIESLPNPDAHVDALAHHFAEAASEDQTAKATRYALMAGRNALERLAFEQARAHFDRGLVHSENDNGAGYRGELFFGLAESTIDDMEARTAALLSAAEEARESGSAVLIARCAMVDLPGVTGTPNDLMLALCEEALDALGDEHPALRVGVLSYLATECTRRGWRVRATTASDEALELASAGADRTLTLRALRAACSALLGSERASDQLALATQGLHLARAARLRDDTTTFLWITAGANLQLGRGEGAAAAAAELAHLGGYANFSPGRRTTHDQFEIVHALLHGNFDEAERLNEEWFGSFTGATQSEFLTYAARLLQLLRERGREDEGAQLLRSVVERQEIASAFHVALAAFTAASGDRDQASMLLDRTAAGGFSVIRDDNTRGSGLAFAAETAARLDAKDHARTVYGLLAPHTGLAVYIGRAVVVIGAADRFLGMLASTLGRHDDADRHFELAMTVERGLRSPPLMARTQLWHARTLLARDAPGDSERARDLLGASLATAETLGMAGVVNEARSFMAG